MASFSKYFRYLSVPLALGSSLCFYKSGINKNFLDDSKLSFVSHYLVVANASYTDSFKSKFPWVHDWDKKHPGAKSKHSVDSSSGDSRAKNEIISGEEQFSKHSRHILLIRHGQYIFGSKDSDCKLTELGHYQANLTGQRLKQLNLPYDRLFFSTMTRATETAQEILKHLPDLPSESTGIIEEGAPYPPEPPLPSYSPSIETFRQDGTRIEAAFRQFFHRAPATQTKDTYEVIVCHANVIRYFLCRALQFPPEAWLRFSLDHGSITWITIRPSGRVAVRYVGSSGHIPAPKCTVQ